MAENKWYEEISGDAKSAGVSSLADRPNRSASYGEGGLTATQLKARFDTLSLLLIDKLNEVIKGITGEDFAKHVKFDLGLEGEKYKSLEGLRSALADGSISKDLPLQVGADKKSLEAFLSALGDDVGEIREVIEKLPEGSTTPIPGKAALYNDNGELTVMLDGESGAAVPIGTVQKMLENLDLDGAGAARIELNMTDDFKITATLYDKDGNAIYTSKKEIDLPLEIAFVGASFDEETNELVFTLKNDETVRVDVSKAIGSFAIEQGTGQSTVAPMSQKATTDALDGKVDRPANSSLGGTIKLLGYDSNKNQKVYILASTVKSVTEAGRIPSYHTSGSGTTLGNGNIVLLTGNPTAPYDAANKKYVDEGLAEKVDKPEEGVEFVKTTDIAQNGKTYGVVTTNASVYGINVSKTGVLYIEEAYGTQIKEKKSHYRPITPYMLDYALRVSISTNTEVMTDEEKQSAQTWLGIDEALARISGQSYSNSYDDALNAFKAIPKNAYRWACIAELGRGRYVSETVKSVINPATDAMTVNASGLSVAQGEGTAMNISDVEINGTFDSMTNGWGRITFMLPEPIPSENHWWRTDVSVVGGSISGVVIFELVTDVESESLGYMEFYGKENTQRFYGSGSNILGYSISVPAGSGATVFNVANLRIRLGYEPEEKRYEDCTEIRVTTSGGAVLRTYEPIAPQFIDIYNGDIIEFVTPSNMELVENTVLYQVKVGV
jgi:hypothetical protein